MPRQSTRAQMLHDIDQTALALARLQYQHAIDDDESMDSESDSSFASLDLARHSDLDIFLNIMITPPSPLSPVLSAFSDFSDFSDSDSSDDHDHLTAYYNRAQDAIATLRDEVAKARVLRKVSEPMP